ncbi:MAG: DUF1289 domain-containing protein [Microbacteriaceae bacterium]|nr:DUF1289 domain-containing protein [Burkholderiaceae bacterium]
MDTLARRARQVRAATGEVVSPCISICRIGTVVPLCEGCFRTLSEIVDWSRMSDADKRVVWVRIETRMRQETA